MALSKEIKSRIHSYFVTKGYEENSRGWLEGDCPSCGNTNKKFGVQVQTNRSKCWVCGEDRRPLEMIMVMENIPDFSRLYRFLHAYKDMGYIDIPEEILNEAAEFKRMELPKEYRMIGLFKSQTSKIVESNLKKRGFRIDRLMAAGVGYCASGDYGGRIIIPYYANNKLIYFNARKFIGGGPKFKNPKAEDFGVGKSQIIYNIDALYIYTKIWLFESATNALTIGNNATATGGKILSSWQISAYVKSQCTEIIIGLDDDAYEEALKLGMTLVQFKKIKVLKFPPGIDANTMGRKGTIELAKNTPYMSYSDLYKEYLKLR